MARTGRPVTNTLAGVWQHIDHRGADECWPWLLSCTSGGYGQYHVGRKGYKAHRVAYEQSTGVAPGALVVRHKCDNPPCCNPNHLELGSVLDNHQDMDSRGRRVSVKGESHGQVRLTDAQVDAILQEYPASGRTQKEIAVSYGVAEGHISNLIRRTRRTK